MKHKKVTLEQHKMSKHMFTLGRERDIARHRTDVGLRVNHWEWNTYYILEDNVIENYIESGDW